MYLDVISFIYNIYFMRAELFLASFKSFIIYHSSARMKRELGANSFIFGIRLLRATLSLGGCSCPCYLRNFVLSAFEGEMSWPPSV